MFQGKKKHFDNGDDCRINILNTFIYLTIGTAQLLMAMMILPPFNFDFSIFFTRLLYSLNVFF